MIRKPNYRQPVLTTETRRSLLRNLRKSLASYDAELHLSWEHLTTDEIVDLQEKILQLKTKINYLDFIDLSEQ